MKYTLETVTAIAIMVISIIKLCSSCLLEPSCGKNSEGYCHKFINYCYLNNANCQLKTDEGRKWMLDDISNCDFIELTGRIGLCTSSCPPPTNCNSTLDDYVCARDYNTKSCTLFENECALKADICANESQRSKYKVFKYKCKGAKLPGDTVPC